MKTNQKKTLSLSHSNTIYELQLEKQEGFYRLTGVRRSNSTGGKALTPLEAEIRQQPPYWVIRTAQGVWRCAAIRTDKGIWVSSEGHTEFFELVKPGAATTTERPTQAEFEIRAPMTGKVVAVRVKEGQRVQPGEVLAIMEAMKMEYRLEAPQPAIVKRVGCREGQLVDLGQPIIQLQPSTSEESR